MARTKETVFDLGDGVEIGMRHDFNAVSNFEELTGKSLLLDGMVVEVSGKHIRALAFSHHLAYHQCRDEAAKLTLLGVGAHINPSNAADLLRAIRGLQATEEGAESGRGPTEAEVPAPTG